MRRRTGSDAHASEVARRRLESLSRELGLESLDPRGRQGDPPGGEDGPSGWEDTPAATSDASGVPRPAGRHALPRLSWRDRLGLWASERVSTGRERQFGSAHLAIVAVVVAASLAVGAWHVMRASAEPERVPVSAPVLDEALSPTADGSDGTTQETPPGASQAGPAASPGAPETEIVVDVVGRVRKPGIAVLTAGSRVVDALKAAGGLRPGTRPDGLNLARPLVDGEQIVVGRSSVPPAAGATVPGASSSSLPGGATGGLVNLNTADAAALDTLPGVGPVTAAAILEWRAQHGGFTAVEELLEVSGIGEATLAEIAPHVTV
jgi:competence protein ComEA